MARQNSIITLKGTIDNLSFYKTKDGNLAKRKTEISASRIATDPSFARTRENNSEFSNAGKASKLLRAALNNITKNVSDSRMVSRLTRLFVEVLHADTVNPRGKRNVESGAISKLKDFNFNISSSLNMVFKELFTSTINRVAGTLTVSIPAFTPILSLETPKGATHYCFNSAGAELDFTADQYVVDSNNSGMLPIDSVSTAPLNLANTVTANSTHPLVLALGIEFFQLVNGVYLPLSSGIFSPLTLTAVSAA